MFRKETESGIRAPRSSLNRYTFQVKTRVYSEENALPIVRMREDSVIGAGFFKDPCVLDDRGFVAVPEGPGLGIEIDPAPGWRRLWLSRVRVLGAKCAQSRKLPTRCLPGRESCNEELVI